MFLNDFNEEDKLPKDRFKETYVPRTYKKHVSTPVQLTNKVPGFDPKDVRHHLGKSTTSLKWSENEKMVRASTFGKRQYEEYPTCAPSSTDFNPLYSSFDRNGCFSPKSYSPQ